MTPTRISPTAPSPARTRIGALLAVTVLAGATGAWAPVALAQNAPAAPLPSTSVPKPGEPITLNFSNAEIESVARTIGLLYGMNVVVDPRVKGP
jgi:general secretion pathway protein D